ncbi:MAG TPA: hypothetical protein VJZ78_05025 [Anaerolineales bacterium]|nr:hypothetical protein [Anaerolineales bacterium]
MALNPTMEFASAVISFLFTIMILSYLVGDNPLFRLGIYVFIGVSAGYAASVAFQDILWPKLFVPLITGNSSRSLFLWIPLFMGVLLVFKLFPRVSRLGNPVMAFLVGIGAAVVIGGAVLGTIIPQTISTINLFDLSAGGSAVEKIFESVVFMIGTISTLVYFQYTARKTPQGAKRGRFVELLSLLGKIFIAITFGVVFAGVLTAALTALVDRVMFIWTFLLSLI